MKPGKRRINRSALPVLLVLALLSVSCSGGDSGAPVAPGGGNQPVVFIADKDMVGQYDIYASFDNGFEIVKLSEQPFVVDGDVADFKISPDGAFVAFRADQEFAGKIELYVVPITGGIPINVSRRFTTILEVEDYQWAPNSGRIAFQALNPDSGPTGGNVELFTNLPDGGSLITVSIAPVQGQDVREFAWAPDSQQIAYTANVIQGAPDRFDLYTTSPVSQDNILLTSILRNIADAKDINWAPNSALIAFLADISFAGVNELLVANPSSPLSSAVAISGTITSGDAVVSFAWAPDSSRVAFLADKKTPDQIELFSVRPDGSDLQEVSDLNSGGNVIDFAWAPDASLLAYIADEDSAALELFTARPDGSFSSIKISGASMAGDVGAFAWSPNADFIAYRADQKVAGRLELFVALPGVAASDVNVSDPVDPDGDVRDFAWAPDSSRVAYRADQLTANTVELFTATPDGVTNDVVSGPLVSGGNVEVPAPLFSGAAFLWSPDADRIAYRADQDTNDVFELFTSRADGSDNTNISGPLAVGGDAQGFAWGSEAF